MKGRHVNEFGRILLVEDDAKDVDLTLNALAEYNLANEVVVVHDGEEALTTSTGVATSTSVTRIRRCCCST